jgi:hypothetical protein
LPPFFFLFPGRHRGARNLRFINPQLTERLPRLPRFPFHPQAASCEPVAGMPHSILAIVAPGNQAGSRKYQIASNILRDGLP